ncbi:MAG: HelD family protein [Acidimicrobiales bacterium]
MSHPDLADEQAYVTLAYEHLAAMRARTLAATEVADSAAQAVDAAIAQAHLQARLRTLDVDVAGLSFGRLDDEAGDCWYVGRRHVEDDRGDPVVVDWRAPVATPFYRATAADPLDLRRRRRFLMTGQHVDDLFDEVFDDPDSVDAAHHGGIPDPLLVELERERTGEMRDIVATIAAEQDVVIRSPLATCLVVQGGPGTGKTAVGLHRAAFLLFEHRTRLDREGVLIVGPNPLFLRYIAQVLPSLGEAAARQTTVQRLVGDQVGREDPAPVARLKGDERMAVVVARALRSQIKEADDLEVATSSGRVRIPAEVLQAAVDEIVARDVTHTVGRAALRARVRRLVALGALARRDDDPGLAAELEAELRSNRELTSALSRLWPAVAAPTLLRRLLTNRRFLAAAADGVLDAEEQALLLRPASGRRVEEERWSLPELVLLEEMTARLDGPGRTYGHAVVDEAQDLSAMELRAIARRCPSRSMTVLGDLAQATAPGGVASWSDVVRHLGDPPNASIEELSLGYRVPGPILEVANRLLPVVAPTVTPTGSVRTDGHPPRAVQARDSIGEAVAAEVAALAARWTSVGVVVPHEVLAEVDTALTAAGVDRRSGTGRLDGAVAVLDPVEAKGLEFDAVVVVEPAAFYDDGAGGRLLYVALTRAVQALTIVHRRPLPAALVAED